jgi:diguanylate cyclase (GGDEF)-like protein
MMLDIDHFKKINDQFGHLTGDHVIKTIAGIINARCRASDVACRWGGEEMLLLLQDCQLSKAVAIANDIRAEVERIPVTCHGRTISLTISAGVAELTDNDSDETVIARADASLYAAKNGGRNQVVGGVGNVAAAAA